MKRKKVLKKQKVGGQRKHDGTSLKLTFLDHALELRSRLILSLGFLLLGSVAGYFFEDRILAFLVRPLGQPLYYTSPGGGFSFTLEIAVFFGFAVRSVCGASDFKEGPIFRWVSSGWESFFDACRDGFCLFCQSANRP